MKAPIIIQCGKQRLVCEPFSVRVWFLKWFLFLLLLVFFAWVCVCVFMFWFVVVVFVCLFMHQFIITPSLIYSFKYSTFIIIHYVMKNPKKNLKSESIVSVCERKSHTFWKYIQWGSAKSITFMLAYIRFILMFAVVQN